MIYMWFCSVSEALYSRAEKSVLNFGLIQVLPPGADSLRYWAIYHTRISPSPGGTYLSFDPDI